MGITTAAIQPRQVVHTGSNLQKSSYQTETKLDCWRRNESVGDFEPKKAAPCSCKAWERRKKTLCCPKRAASEWPSFCTKRKPGHFPSSSSSSVRRRWTAAPLTHWVARRASHTRDDNRVAALQGMTEKTIYVFLSKPEATRVN